MGGGMKRRLSLLFEMLAWKELLIHVVGILVLLRIVTKESHLYLK